MQERECTFALTAAVGPGDWGDAVVIARHATPCSSASSAVESDAKRVEKG